MLGFNLLVFSHYFLNIYINKSVVLINFLNDWVCVIGWWVHRSVQGRPNIRDSERRRASSAKLPARQRTFFDQALP
jgi:hypothetical protein